MIENGLVKADCPKVQAVADWPETTACKQLQFVLSVFPLETLVKLLYCSQVSPLLRSLFA